MAHIQVPEGAQASSARWRSALKALKRYANSLTYSFVGLTLWTG